MDAVPGGPEPPAGVLGSPSGWARINLHYLQGADLEYQSLAESLAIEAWRRRERIDLLRTMAVVTAAVNPEKAQQVLHKLIEAMFPEQAIEREKAVENALEIMEKEKDRVYSVSKVGAKASKSTALGRVRDILGKNRRGRK